jgi:hypothetical protein
MTDDPVRVIAYDALFPQLAALEAGLDLAQGGAPENFDALRAQYQEKIDGIKTQNPEMVEAVTKALPQLQAGLSGEPTRPGEDAGTEAWKSYRMEQNKNGKSANTGRGAGPAKAKPTGAPAYSARA